MSDIDAQSDLTGRLALQAEFEKAAQVSADGNRITLANYVATKGTSRLGMHFGFGNRETWRIVQVPATKKAFTAVLHNVPQGEVIAIMAEHAAWDKLAMPKAPKL